MSSSWERDVERAQSKAEEMRILRSRIKFLEEENRQLRANGAKLTADNAVIRAAFRVAREDIGE